MNLLRSTPGPTAGPSLTHWPPGLLFFLHCFTTYQGHHSLKWTTFAIANLSAISVPIWVCNGQYEPVKSASYLFQLRVFQQILTRKWLKYRMKHVNADWIFSNMEIYFERSLWTLIIMLSVENLQKISCRSRPNPFSRVHLKTFRLRPGFEFDFCDNKFF